MFVVIACAKPKILLLDDDSAFLDVAAYYLKQKLGNTVFVSKFNTSQGFLEHIHNHCYLPEIPHDIIQAFYAGRMLKKDIEQALIDLSELPAILVIDYHLRNETINGAELSKQIAKYVGCPYIVLLTAEVDTITALQLHNDKVIDLFIRKDDPNPMEYLYSHLSTQISKLVIECHVEIEDIFGSETILETVPYIAKREELLNEMDYKSYLTISAEGAIAVLDNNNKINYFTYNNKAFSLNG